MSNPLRISFVTEGPTDYVVLRAAVRALLGGADFEPVALQPELDESLRTKSASGWGGVYFWCRQTVAQTGGPASGNPLFASDDALIVIQVDADIARRSYADYEIKDAPKDDLPCEQPCPPPGATTDPLRSVILGWLNETATPPQAVLCTPSKNIETWILVGLFPENEQVAKPNIECRWGLDVQLRKYGPIKGTQKLIDAYRANEAGIGQAWRAIRARCTEAERFSQEFLALLPGDPTSQDESGSADAAATRKIQD